MSIQQVEVIIFAMAVWATAFAFGYWKGTADERRHQAEKRAAMKVQSIARHPNRQAR